MHSILYYISDRNDLEKVGEIADKYNTKKF